MDDFRRNMRFMALSVVALNAALMPVMAMEGHWFWLVAVGIVCAYGLRIWWDNR